MGTQVISDARRFLEEHGFLHDVRIHEFLIDVKAARISMLTPDMFAGIRASDDGFGSGKRVIVFNDVKYTRIDIELEAGVRISRAIYEEDRCIYFELNEGCGKESWESRRPAISFWFSFIEIVIK